MVNEVIPCTWDDKTSFEKCDHEPRHLSQGIQLVHAVQVRLREFVMFHVGEVFPEARSLTFKTIGGRCVLTWTWAGKEQARQKTKSWTGPWRRAGMTSIKISRNKGFRWKIFLREKYLKPTTLETGSYLLSYCNCSPLGCEHWAWEKLKKKSWMKGSRRATHSFHLLITLQCIVKVDIDRVEVMLPGLAACYCCCYCLNC